MKRVGLKKPSSILTIFMSALLFGVVVFGVSQVHDSGIMEEHKSTSFCHIEDCNQPVDDPMCVSFCLSGFENSLQTLPVNFLFLALTVFVFSWLVIVVLNFVSGQSFYNLKSFVRKRRESYILSYFAQLGSWLVLFGKRDPSLVFASI